MVPYDFENDTIKKEINGNERGISFNAWLKQTDKFFEDEEWKEELFWFRNFYPHDSMIIDDLHKRGLLEAGEYLMNVDW